MPGKDWRTTSLVTIVLFAFIYNPQLFGQTKLTWFLPINVPDRQSWEQIQLTNIGAYGLMRKARPNIPAHYHTGIDFKRPGNNYIDEPIYPIATGKVISQRDDGPYAQIIIEHSLDDSTFLWSVYEHVAGIATELGQTVDPKIPIARFMTKAELDKHGWQFDHVHLEIMKVKPKSRKPDKARPDLYFGTYALVCYKKADLDKHYHHPQEFLVQQWGTEQENIIE